MAVAPGLSAGSYRDRRPCRTNSPAAGLRPGPHELGTVGGLDAGRKETAMELIAAMPEWLVWCAAGGAAMVALAVVVNTIEAALDLDT